MCDWIRVESELPEEKSYVLGWIEEYAPAGDHQIICYDGIDKENHPLWSIDIPGEDYSVEIPYLLVTHWQPLPDMPQIHEEDAV